MVNYKLDKKDFINQKRLFLIKVTNELENREITHMETLIGYFNQEYTWDKMFKIEDVFDRLKNKHTLYILIYDNNPLGYVWFKELDDGSVLLYNLYVTKQIKRTKLLPVWFVNEVCSEMLQIYPTIKCECEDWNTSAQTVFELNNFKAY